MTTKISSDDLLAALGSLKPETDDLASSWYIGRREHTLQQVLTRAADDTEPAVETTTTVLTPKWRHPRRTILAGVAAVAMLGGGTAWALSNYTIWYSGGGLTDLTCVTSWHAPDVDRRDDQYGGPELSTDPIADCERYAELTGKPRIVDPIAVRWDGARVVGPREGRPADAVPIAEWQPPTESPSSSTTPPAPPRDVVRDQAKEMELTSSLEDRVDGGNSRCWDADTGTAFAQAELDRLGLTGWEVTVEDQEILDGDCAFLFVPDPPGTIRVRTHSQDDPASTASTDLASELRREIADKCLSLDEAQQVVDRLLGEDEHHWPTAIQTDPDASCTRVDLVYGGSQQVYLYGPETAKR